MKRPDWQAALDQYIACNQAQPFSYDWELGLDCCTFTFGAIRAQTGKPIGEQFRSGYRTKKQSLERMRDYAGRPSLRLFVVKLMAEYSFEPVIWSFAQRGNAVLFPNGRGEAFGILDMGGKDVISVAEQGLVRIPISPRCKCWRIS